MEYNVRDCPYYIEEHDMGATIPLCEKTGGVCYGCQSETYPFQNVISRGNIAPEELLTIAFLLMSLGGNNDD